MTLSFSMFREFKKCFVGMLVLTIILPSVYFSFPQKTEAFWPTFVVGSATDVVTVPATVTTAVATPVSAANSTIQTVLQTAQHLKTWVLDPLAMMTAKIIIQDITAATVKWINSGFKGNPAFIQDPETFFTNVGDQAASTFLSSTNSAWANFVCSPFSAKIQLALVQNYLSTKNPVGKCSISSIIKNWQNFGTNFYDNGGWDGWFSMTQNQSNNPVGSYMQQKDALALKVQSSQNHYQAQLTMGNGFLSWETCKPRSAVMGPVLPPTTTTPASNAGVDCDADPEFCAASSVDTTSAPTPTPSPTDCPYGKQTNTPGSVIQAQLSKTLGSTMDQLGVAQSINQIVGALMTEMVKKVVGGFGSGGLSGLSQSSTGTQSLQAQLEAGASPSSTQSQNQINQINSTEQTVVTQSTASTTQMLNNHPLLTLIGDNPLNLQVGASFSDPGATASDATDGDITGQITKAGMVDTSTAGTYNITYSVTNSHGVSATAVRTVSVGSSSGGAQGGSGNVTVTLNGSNPLTWQQGQTWQDPNAIASNGDTVVPDSSPDINVKGSYTITYSAIDPQNGPVGSITRTVIVQ